MAALATILYNFRIQTAQLSLNKLKNLQKHVQFRQVMGCPTIRYAYTFVKLHSELALPTELQLDRVGVDFVFPLSQQQQQPSPKSTRRKYATDLIFGT